MTKFSTSLTINASQEATWKVLSDVAHWHEWTPTVTKVEVLNTPEIKLSNRYKVFQPKLQPVEWKVTVLTPPSNFTWESRSPGMHMVAEHILTSKGTNQTELTLHLRIQWLARQLHRQDVRQIDRRVYPNRSAVFEKEN